MCRNQSRSAGHYHHMLLLRSGSTSQGNGHGKKPVPSAYGEGSYLLISNVGLYDVSSSIGSNYNWPARGRVLVNGDLFAVVIHHCCESGAIFHIFNLHRMHV